MLIASEAENEDEANTLAEQEANQLSEQDAKEAEDEAKETAEIIARHRVQYRDFTYERDEYKREQRGWNEQEHHKRCRRCPRYDDPRY